ncbi:MAG: diguanylate cyclase [Sporomusaceae bacterium]|nr:diguanylate cyclase [Sporomusaceae bacterium]
MIQKEEEFRRLLAELSGTVAGPELLQQMLDAMSQGVLLLNSERKVLLYNRQFVRMLRFKASEVYVGQEYENLLSLWCRRSNQPEELLQKNLLSISKKKSYEIEYSWQDSLAKLRWLYVENRPLASGAILRTYTDITKMKRDEQILKESETSFRSIFEVAPFPVAVISQSGKILHGNKCFMEFYELQEDDLEQLYPLDFFLDSSVRRRLLHNLTMEGAVDGFEAQIRTFRTQLVRWVMIAARPLSVLGQSCLLTMQIDLTERKRLEEDLRRLATSDGLTGLNNRRYFLEIAERVFQQASRYQEQLAVLVLDIDHFKGINDTYGHQSGDIVLQELAQCLSQILREVDVIGRIGGEEFAVLLPQTDNKGALSLAERMRQAVEAYCFHLPDGQIIKVTISIGFTLFYINDKDFDQVLRRADEGLYLAKKSGRNQVQQGPDPSAAN